MVEKRLNEQDLKNYLENGYVYLENAFTTETATECRNILWNQLENKEGVMRSDPTTWRKKVSLENIFTKGDGVPWSNVYGNKIYEILDEICGRDGCVPTTNCGWWMITCPGFDDAPWDAAGSWHVDGHWYRHYPFSSEIGAILVMFFSDVEPEMGGTAVAVGSHKCIARALVHAGTRGLCQSELAHVVSSCLSQTRYPLVELTGKAGDVVVMHPFLIHARSKNLGHGVSAVRFMCHPNIHLKQPMNLSPSNLPHMTPLEQSIYQACAEYRPPDVPPPPPSSSSSSSSSTLQIDSNSTETTHQLCTCHYHLHNPLEPPPASSSSPSSPSQSQSAPPLYYPSLLDLLKEITPEACENLQQRKRIREQEGAEGEEGEEDSNSTDKKDGNIAAVMGFGEFQSSNKKERT